VRAETDAARRVARAREVIGTFVEAWQAQEGPAAMAAESFAHEAERTDGGFAHDSLSRVNDPVYFTQCGGRPAARAPTPARASTRARRSCATRCSTSCTCARCASR
jgi:hypothetical protein